ncbi:MAG: HAMP domain-containing sensor histidine kinase [Elusimicrobiota bacterium]
MRKYKNLGTIMLVLFLSIPFYLLWIKPFYFKVMLFVLFLVFTALYVFFRAFELRFNRFWKVFFKSVCSNISFIPSMHNTGRMVDHIISRLCRLPGIDAAWLLEKGEDGFFRMTYSRGIKTGRDMAFRDISEYIGINEEDFEEPLISHGLAAVVDTPISHPVLHFPIQEGDILIAVFSITVTSKKQLRKYGMDNFRVIADLLERIFESIYKDQKFKSAETKAQVEVDTTTDELTKTNLRLIERVREMKSIHELTSKVHNSETVQEASEQTFDHIQRLLQADEAVYMKLVNSAYIPVFATFRDITEKIGTESIGSDVFSGTDTKIISDMSEAEEFKTLFLNLELNVMLMVKSKVADKVNGIMIAGSGKEVDYSVRELELLQIYSNMLAEYIERKSLISELIEKNAELEQFNESKDNFIALISHELKTPLTSIKGFSEMLKNGDAGSLNDIQMDFLSTIEQSTKRLETRINNIIEVSSLKKGRIKLDKETIQWKTLVTGVYDQHRDNIADKGLKSSLDVADDIGNISADKTKISKALGNLISNAVKFTNTGGKLDVVAVKKGDFVETSVIDTGIGVSDEMKSKIFERFIQVEKALTRSVGGLGLGLSFARDVIESHGGQIVINSKPGKGTKATFILPVKDEHMEVGDKNE